MFAASRVARVLVRSSAAHAPHAPPAFGGTCRRALSSSSRPRDDDEGPVAATEAETHAFVDMDAFLAPLRNHERTGVPRGAGSSASDPEQRFDLGRMRRLLATLGDPHVGYPVIHVAGTKGKGSVVSFLAAILREAGVNTGTYKSPHVRSVRERIVCGPFDAARRGAADGAALSADGGLDAATAEATRAFLESESAKTSAKSASDKNHRQETTVVLSYFEALTAFAFVAFKRANVECAVVEVGVGGAVDATNVVPAAHTAASVLTALGDDHLEALGGSQGAVANAKAGIVRTRRPVFVGTQPCVELEVLLLSSVYAAGGRLVDENDVEVRAVSRGVVGLGYDSKREGDDVAQIVDFEIASRSRDDDGVKPLEWRALRGVRMRALGPHQRENARLAVSVIAFLRRGGGARRDGGDARATDAAVPWSRVADDDVRRGLETAHSPGCFEILRRPDGVDPPVWIVADGAHTAGSAEAAFATLRETTLLEMSKSRNLAVVVAMASDKNHVDVMREVLHAKPAFVFCAETLVSGGTARAAPATALRDAFRAAMQEKEKHKENATVDAETHHPRVVVIPELERAMAEAVDAVRDRGGGVVCVLGSLNVVARAETWANGTGGE